MSSLEKLSLMGRWHPYEPIILMEEQKFVPNEADFLHGRPSQ